MWPSTLATSRKRRDVPPRDVFASADPLHFASVLFGFGFLCFLEMSVTIQHFNSGLSTPGEGDDGKRDVVRTGSLPAG